jgi:hypothetical protein
MDTNVCMIKENPEDGPSCTMAGRWYRDPSLPIQRTEITRFPHAVFEIRMALGSEQSTPEWVQELIESGTAYDEFHGQWLLQQLKYCSYCRLTDGNRQVQQAYPRDSYPLSRHGSSSAVLGRRRKRACVHAHFCTRAAN